MKSIYFAVFVAVVAGMFGLHGNAGAEIKMFHAGSFIQRQAIIQGAPSVETKIAPDVESYGEDSKRLTVTIKIMNSNSAMMAPVQVETESAACQPETMPSASYTQNWSCPLTTEKATFDTSIKVRVGSETQNYKFYTGQSKLLLSYATPDPWDSLYSSYPWPTPQDIKLGSVQLKATFLQLYHVVDERTGEVVSQGSSNFRNPIQCGYYETYTYPDGLQVAPGWRYYAPEPVTASNQQECNASYSLSNPGQGITKWRMKTTLPDGSKIFSNELDWEDVAGN